MNIRNKRAISPIIATTLIIMMTIAGVAIIWGVVMPIIKRGATEIASACIGMDLTIETRGGVTCYNATSGTIDVSISRGAASEGMALEKIQVIVFGKGESESVIIDSLEYTLPGINEQKTYSLNTTLTPEKVSIAPIIAMGDTVKTCEVTHEADILACK